MKKYLMCCLLLLLVSTADAQTVVVSYNKVKWGHGGEYNDHVKKYVIPGLDKQVEAGNLISYQVLGHNMGDEWNDVVIYQVKDYSSWEKAYQGIFKYWRENAPDEERKKHMKRIDAHKDNIYSVRHPKSKK
jgi:hypothetical protein